MKRKTNLFYTQGPDSKFITFSNYTESLTGNFLSTDTKLYPSRFLCLYIGGLTNDNKSSLIKYLSEYYESKLAVLRDNLESKDIKIEHNIYPLPYLLEALYSIDVITSTEVVSKNIYDKETSSGWKTINEQYIKNSPIKIRYISDITEQDYNGTFTDTICIVDLEHPVSGSIELDSTIDTDDEVCNIDVPIRNDNKCLYGWEHIPVTSQYANSYSRFDNIIDNKKGDKKQGQYRFKSSITGIKLNHKKDIDSIKFNCIIPLFDVTNINYRTNSTILIDDEHDIIDLQDSSQNNMYTKNVPLGIWFADDLEEGITIKKDPDTGFSQTWSLTLSSQFKPFPYSKSMPNEIKANSNSNSFATFSQVLSKLNDVTDKFNKMEIKIDNLSKRIEEVQANYNIIGTTYNIDKIHNEFIDFERESNSNFEQFRKQILSYIANLRWQATV